MTEIGRTLLFSFQMTCIGSKIRVIILIPVILADFVINLGEFCGLGPPKLDNLCFRVFILLEKKNQIVGSKVKLLEQNEWRIYLQKAIN